MNKNKFIKILRYEQARSAFRNIVYKFTGFAPPEVRIHCKIESVLVSGVPQKSVIPFPQKSVMGQRYISPRSPIPPPEVRFRPQKWFRFASVLTFRECEPCDSYKTNSYIKNCVDFPILHNCYFKFTFKAQLPDKIVLARVSNFGYELWPTLASKKVGGLQPPQQP